MFKRDPLKAAEKAARREERRAARAVEAAARQAEKDALKAWRRKHPAESSMSAASFMQPWPSSKMGVTPLGPVKGGSAELFNAGAHKAWTATRLAAGVATGGLSAMAVGRKNKGAAAINITFGNGAVQTYDLTSDADTLRLANQYVTAFNALSAQLAAEETTQL
ncbi:hypothetical protein ACFWW5_11230 [Streptomyces albidoflavus]